LTDLVFLAACLTISRFLAGEGAGPFPHGVNTPVDPPARAQKVVLVNVILRHAYTGFFYGGRHCWVNGRERAVDLGTIERAVETGLEERFGQMEVVAWPGDPQCQLAMPLRCGEASHPGTLPVEAPSSSSAPPQPSLDAAVPDSLPPNPGGTRT
jgi:hypothetical protein